MDLKVKEDTYNPLLKRKEVRVEVEHDAEGTPSRLDLRKAIAAKFNTKPDNVFVLDVETPTGTQSAVCAAEVYDDAQLGQRTVPKYIQVRHLPAEERKQLREQEAKKEAKPKAEKPKAQPKAEKPKEEKTEKPKEEGKEEKPKAEAKAPGEKVKQEVKPPTEPPKKSKGSDAK